MELMARNLIALPPELHAEFAHNLKKRGPKKKEPCVAWYVKYTELDVYLLCMQQMGYLLLVESDMQLDEAIVDEIEGGTGLDLPPEHVIWGSASTYPKQVKKRLNKGLAAVRESSNLEEADAKIRKINLEPYPMGKKKFPPQEAFVGYFTEVREDIEYYVHNMSLPAKLWHMISSKFPWN